MNVVTYKQWVKYQYVPLIERSQNINKILFFYQEFIQREKEIQDFMYESMIFVHKTNRIIKEITNEMNIDQTNKE